jgi:hypothetical protein
VAEHGGRGLRFLHDPERHIGLGEPEQGFLDVARPLIAGHHDLEAIDGAGVVAAVQQLPPDVHLLAGQLVAGDLDLALGGDGVFAVRILARHLFEGLHRFFGAFLVARDFSYLIEIGRADQVLGIGGVRASRMQRHVAPRGTDAVS